MHCPSKNIRTRIVIFSLGHPGSKSPIVIYFHQDVPSWQKYSFQTLILSVLEPQKFIAEQMSQLLFHVTSAKAIASQVLAAIPDPYHWRDSFQGGTDTLNYLKQVLQSLHSTGFN